MSYKVHRKHVQRFCLALRTASHRLFLFRVNCPHHEAVPALQEQAAYYVRHLDRSRWGKYGKKSYKAVYHRRRRREAYALERAVLLDDDFAFESIAPEAWRGAIAWDIW
jgi:hypothetical protein